MINVVVEGESDKGMASAVVRAAGNEIGKLIAPGGKTRIDPLIVKYSQAALRSPWVVFRDSDAECPVRLREELMAKIGTVSPYFFASCGGPHPVPVISVLLWIRPLSTWRDHRF
jgi:hypothetical protein